MTFHKVYNNHIAYILHQRQTGYNPTPPIRRWTYININNASAPIWYDSWKTVQHRQCIYYYILQSTTKKLRELLISHFLVATKQLHSFLASIFLRHKMECRKVANGWSDLQGHSRSMFDRPHVTDVLLVFDCHSCAISKLLQLA